MHKLLKEKKSAFTLIEITIVAMILGILIPTVFSIYNFIIKANREVHARQEAIQQGYEFFERLNIWMQDYTIDYEEYYNRQMVGCGGGTGSDFTWNIGTGGHCTEFTAYGNNNSTGRGGVQSWHDIYYCSSKKHQNGDKLKPKVVNNNCGNIGVQQSYGQYEALFTDVRKDTDKDGNLIGDSDDKNLGSGSVNAIVDADNVQELYLISNDGKTRLFFRRKLKKVSEDGLHHQYVIQMLRLRGFDAGYQHNFGSQDKRGMYDGVIDTWACDAGMGFECSGNSIGGAYSNYKLPKDADADDGWIDITHGPINVYTWSLSLSPYVDPDLSWADPNDQINPYVKFLAVFGVYVPYYKGKMAESIINFKIPIQTAISTKSFYKS